MDNTLSNYLKKFKDDTEFYTHVSQMRPYTGKFRIERKDKEEFWKIYCDNLYKNKDNFFSGLSERPLSYIPVLVDIDIAIDYDEEKYDEHNLEHFYKPSQIRHLVNIYIDVLKYIIPDYKREDMVCFVLEKSKPYVSGCRIKNGFHLHFPFIFMSNVDQDIHLIPRVVKRVDEEEVFESLGVEKSSDYIDKSCTKKHWLMYGGRKDTKLEGYKVTKIFNHKGEETTLASVMKQQVLYDENNDEITIQESMEEYYLPRILSIHTQTRQQYEAKDQIEIIPKKFLQKAEDIKKYKENMPITEALAQVRKLMPMLSQSRSDNYNEWIEVGWILYNVGEGCQEMLEEWIDFSRRTTKENFSEAGCVYRWNKMTRGNYSIATLRFMAKKDSPEKYEEFTKEEQRQLIHNSILGGQTDIAKQLYGTYGSQFVCADLQSDTWYEFRDHKWHRIQKGITLRSKITHDILPKYIDETKLMFDHLKGEGANSTRHKELSKLVGSLKSATFKNNIMKECQEFFYNQHFLEKLDTNPYLVGFSNGVLDLRTCEFRDGKPEDYIYKTCGYNYQEFDEDDPEVLEVKDFLFKLFPRDVSRQYALEYCAKLLKSGNFSKNFLVFSGQGDNGKSVFIELLEKTLGEYMVTLSPKLITGKEADSNAASPDLELTKGCKFVVLPEPDGRDTINPGPLKRLTGNDRFYSRGLFKEGSPVVAMFKLCLICNRLPRIALEGSEAVWNRVRVLLFESKFPKNNEEVPKSFDEQIRRKVFYRDNTLSEKLPYMKQAFMWLMFQTYKHIIKYGEMTEPEIVTECTSNYKQNNDVYLQFINERVVEDRSPSNKGLTLSDAYAEFKSWFSESLSGTGLKLFSKNDFKEELLKKWGPMRGNVWKIYRIKTLRDEEDEGNIIVLDENDFLNE
jgi:P4 family phage/plasmid primase-like protien